MIISMYWLCMLFDMIDRNFKVFNVSKKKILDDRLFLKRNVIWHEWLYMDHLKKKFYQIESCFEKSIPMYIFSTIYGLQKSFY